MCAPPDRKAWIELARRWHALPGGDRARSRPRCLHRAQQGRAGSRLRPRRAAAHDLRRFDAACVAWSAKAFGRSGGCRRSSRSRRRRIERRPLWTDKRDDHGPFDIIGDVHGCADELRRLLGAARLRGRADGERRRGHGAAWPQARLRRRSRRSRPRTPDVLRIVMAAQARRASRYAVQGNHDRKLSRWLDGRNVKIAHGLQESIDQLAPETPGVPRRGEGFPRRSAQPLLARWRPACGRACRA